MLDYLTNEEYKGETVVAIDEVGRGCLAGPVYACAVVLDSTKIDEKTLFKDVKDSKKLSEKKRVKVRDFLKENVLEYSIGVCSAKEIDEINILKATHLAMHRALDGLKTKFDRIIVDGNSFTPYSNEDLCEDQMYYSHDTVVSGDAVWLDIAAASILAKVARDEYMDELVANEPEKYEPYGFKKNKGYGTSQHLKQIRDSGKITEIHRKTFGICKNYE